MDGGSVGVLVDAATDAGRGSDGGAADDGGANCVGWAGTLDEIV